MGRNGSIVGGTVAGGILIYANSAKASGYCFSGLSHELGFVQGLKVDGALILEDAFYNPENLLSEIEK